MASRAKAEEKEWASNRAAKRPKVVENADFAVSKTVHILWNE